jgi:hypothetical protein
VRGRLISTSCPTNQQRNATAQIFPSIPLQTESRTEGGRQVIYFRFAAQPEESENECKKDEEECDTENCKCSPSKDDLTLDCKKEETGECDQDKCKCSPQNSKEDLTVQKEEEEKDNGFSWWKCDKPDCDCQKSNKQTFEFDKESNTCTFIGQNGMQVVIPCHHCFTFGEEEYGGGQRQRTNTRVGRQLEQASNPASTSSYYVANVQNIECGNMKLPKWEKKC